MKDAKKFLGTEPYYDWKNEQIKVWKDCVENYNRLSRFYRNQGIDVEPIKIPYNTPPELTPEILKLRILAKRTFRDIIRNRDKMSDLSEKDINKDISMQGLNP